jgi:hypothetical protein
MKIEERSHESLSFSSLLMHRMLCVHASGSLLHRTLFTAIFLLVIGIAFTPVGIVFVYKYGWTEAAPFLTVGGVGSFPSLPDQQFHACIFS